jgi:hypothetical protein
MIEGTNTNIPVEMINKGGKGGKEGNNIKYPQD